MDAYRSPHYEATLKNPVVGIIMLVSGLFRTKHTLRRRTPVARFLVEMGGCRELRYNVHASSS